MNSSFHIPVAQVTQSIILSYLSWLCLRECWRSYFLRFFPFSYEANVNVIINVCSYLKWNILLFLAICKSCHEFLTRQTMSDQTLEAAAIRVEAIAEETPFQVEASEPHTGVSSKCYLSRDRYTPLPLSSAEALASHAVVSPQTPAYPSSTFLSHCITCETI